jgi:hypothetical protein
MGGLSGRFLSAGKIRSNPISLKLDRTVRWWWWWVVRVCALGLGAWYRYMARYYMRVARGSSAHQKAPWTSARLVRTSVPGTCPTCDRTVGESEREGACVWGGTHQTTFYRRRQRTNKQLGKSKTGQTCLDLRERSPFFPRICWACVFSFGPASQDWPSRIAQPARCTPHGGSACLPHLLPRGIRFLPFLPTDSVTSERNEKTEEWEAMEDR